MVEALIVAGAILASAALLAYYSRESDEIKIRRMARTLVRAVEKRGEWDATIATEHVKRARVKLVLSDRFPKMDEDWVDVVIEEAVFDMEADHGRITAVDFGRGAERARGGSERHAGDYVSVAGDWGVIGESGPQRSDTIGEWSGYEIGGETPEDPAPAVEA